MSVGSWALLLFGVVTFISFLAALSESGRLRRPALTFLRPPAPLGLIIAILGGVLDFFVTSDTCVLLAVTDQPICRTNLLGLVFPVVRRGVVRGAAREPRASVPERATSLV